MTKKTNPNKNMLFPMASRTILFKSWLSLSSVSAQSQLSLSSVTAQSQLSHSSIIWKPPWSFLSQTIGVLSRQLEFYHQLYSKPAVRSWLIKVVNLQKLCESPSLAYKPLRISQAHYLRLEIHQKGLNWIQMNWIPTIISRLKKGI